MSVTVTPANFTSSPRPAITVVPANFTSALAPVGVTYATGVGPVSGTPTLAIYNLDGTAATASATSPVQAGSTGVWAATFVAAPGKYNAIWTAGVDIYAEFAEPADGSGSQSAGPSVAIQRGPDLEQLVGGTVPVRMVSNSDHATGVDGLTLTITASKNGPTPATLSPPPTVVGRGGGLYWVTLGGSAADTSGIVLLVITATGADPVYVACQVVKIQDGVVASVSGGVVSLDTTDDLNGSSIRFLDGPAVRQPRTIAAQNGAAVTPDRAWSPLPAAGDRYVLGVPSTSATQLATAIATPDPESLAGTVVSATTTSITISAGGMTAFNATANVYADSDTPRYLAFLSGPNKGVVVRVTGSSLSAGNLTVLFAAKAGVVAAQAGNTVRID